MSGTVDSTDEISGKFAHRAGRAMSPGQPHGPVATHGSVPQGTIAGVKPVCCWEMKK